MAKKKGDFTITIPADSIRGTEVMRSGDYKYGRVSAKLNDNEYVSVTYEWKGEDYVPEAVLSLFQYIKANLDSVDENYDEVSSLNNRISGLKK